MSQSIDNLMAEKRSFTPRKDFSDNAHVSSMAQYKELYEEAQNNPEIFWKKQAENLQWDNPYSQLLDWNLPQAKWFVGGKLNASVQCLDKNLDKHGNKKALVWEGEPGDTRSLTYQELYELTCQTANALKEMGVQTGDRVAIYMPLVPESVAAMLACARIGAAHSVIFGGFSSESIKDRINDAQCTAVITADGGWRRGQIVNLKSNVDEALKGCPSIKSVLVLQRTKNEVEMKSGRDHWWHEIVAKQETQHPPVSMDSEDLLFVLYTSGTTGKPKGIMHSTAGYLLWAQLSSKWVFDLKDEDLYWCTADIGWITGHTYLVYGPLQNATTSFIYEGAPNHPDFSRFWQMIEKHKISILYTAPTAIRAFMRAGDELVTKHNLDSLRLLGTVGEPINPEAWMWYHKTVGQEKCPIVDTWWQTETGGIMMSTLPGAAPAKPGSCALPLPGIHPQIVNKDGTPCEANSGGLLVVDKPWPSMTRGVYGDQERFVKTYWSDFEGKYFTGDGARVDEDGYFWVMGRVDDVLNVAGHRLGTAEIESALVSHSQVAEAAVVGRPDEIKGQGIVAFVTLKSKYAGSSPTDELKAHVAKEIGAIAKPDDIRFTDGLPKTRSGKIMRRLLRELAQGGKVKGDTTTLEDRGVIAKLAESYQEE